MKQPPLLDDLEKIIIGTIFLSDFWGRCICLSRCQWHNVVSGGLNKVRRFPTNAAELVPMIVWRKNLLGEVYQFAWAAITNTRVGY